MYFSIVKTTNEVVLLKNNFYTLREKIHNHECDQNKKYNTQTFNNMFKVSTSKVYLKVLRFRRSAPYSSNAL